MMTNASFALKATGEAVGGKTHQAAKGLKAKHGRKEARPDRGREETFREENTDRSAGRKKAFKTILRPVILLQIVNIESGSECVPSRCYTVTQCRDQNTEMYN